MKNFKIWFSAFLFVISVFACSGVFKVGKSYSANQYARLAIEKETAEIEKENKALEEQCLAYTKDIEASKKAISKNEDENKELEEYYSQISEYEKNIDTYKRELSEVNAEARSLGKNIDLTDISNEASGEKVKYTDKTLICPDDIEEGRYKIEGDGFFRIINTSNNNVTESQNVKNLDGNSYTANINKNSKIIIEGTLTLTPVN